MKAITAFILGFTFSFGWTPCIGPILASVLVMVSSSSNHLSANLLIAVYTIGFILPFIITAMFYSKLFKTIDKIKSNMEIIKNRWDYTYSIRNINDGKWIWKYKQTL